MYKNKLRINQNAQLRIIDGLYVGTYASRIEDIGDDYLKIAMPIAQGQLVPVGNGTKIEVLVYDQANAYSFSSIVDNRQAFPIPILKIKFPDKVKKVQRRDFVRIDSAVPVQYFLVDNNEAPNHGRNQALDKHNKDQNQVFESANTVDISGGGLCLSTNHPLEYGQTIALKIKLPQYDEFGVMGKVTRSSEISDKTREKRYVSGIKFIDIDERDRDKIISFIFELQRQLRRKGLI